MLGNFHIINFFSPFGKFKKNFYGVYLELRAHEREVSRQVQCQTLQLVIR